VLLAVLDGRGLGENLDVVRFTDVVVLGADDGELSRIRLPRPDGFTA
jgi:hypothetical protein